MKQSPECCIIASLALTAWNRRKALFYFLSAVSLTGNLLSLLRWDALSSCRSLCYSILPELWRILCILLHPPYLYILLNLILIKVVTKSGVLTPAKEEDIPQGLSSRIHLMGSWKASLHDLDVEESGDSDNMKPVESTVGQKRPSLFIIEPIEIDADVFPAPRDLREQDNSSFKTGTPDSALPTSVTDQRMIVYDQKPAPACHHALMNNTLVKVEAQVLLIEDSDLNSEQPDQQLVQIGGVEDWHEEMSTEELNRRADAYIQEVRKNWWLQRQDSFNRLYGLISGDSRLRST